MALPRGAFLLLALVAAVSCQEGPPCTCEKNKRTVCELVGNTCKCKSYGSSILVDCTTLTSKCLLMKAEVAGLGGRRNKPKNAHVDNDGLYNPECDNEGNFKAKQCNGTSTCWCVNSAGVRRTEKSDGNITCSEVVRTSWIMIETKHAEKNSPLVEDSVVSAIKNAISERYHLSLKHINVKYEKPSILIELKQNISEKSATDVDIADAAYYFEKDVKEDPLITKNLDIMVAGEPLQFHDTIIYYVDEKAPEFTMKRLTNGVIAVIVVVVLAVVAGVLVLVFTRRKRGKYEKAEVKEMNEMHRELNS